MALTNLTPKQKALIERIKMESEQEKLHPPGRSPHHLYIRTGDALKQEQDLMRQRMRDSKEGSDDEPVKVNLTPEQKLRIEQFHSAWLLKRKKGK